MEKFIQFSHLDQLSSRMNIIVCVFFKVPDSARTAIISRLESSLAALTATNPILAAEIRPHRSRPGHKEAAVIDRIPCKIAHVEQLTYTDIEEAQFELCHVRPWEFLPTYRQDEGIHYTLAVQATFVAGGVVFTFDLDHTLCDGSGCGAILSLLAHFYAGTDPGTLVAEVQTPRLSAEHLMPLDEALANGGPLQATGDNVISPPTGEHGFGLYHIPQEKLQRLKEYVTRALGSRTDCPWISTLDAVVAFIWTCSMQARTSVLEPEVHYILLVMVNIRNRMQPSIPPGYIGNCVNVNAQARTLSRLTTTAKNLADIAASIRIGNGACANLWLSRMLALIEAEEDLSRVVYTPSIPHHHFLTTSWADNPIEKLDFGNELGRPDQVRVLGLPGARNLCVIQPRDSRGGLNFNLSLERAATDALESNPEWCDVVEKVVPTKTKVVTLS